MMSASKKTRNELQDNDIDIQEMNWWNNYAGLISKVWEMDPWISWNVRKGYLSCVKRFFKNDKKNVTILEIGCGSGWVGQFIAGNNIHIIGTDFSQEQINLAQQNAHMKKKQDYCHYFLSRSDTFPPEVQQIHGVLIHCLLHHLSNEEISKFFRSLKQNVKSGTKIFIYEPAFFESIPNRPQQHLDFKTSLLLHMSIFFDALLISSLTTLHAIDRITDTQFKKLNQIAEDKGWYLSPKEIPLEISEFSATLQEYCSINDVYWKTFYSIGWSYNVNIIRYPTLRRFLGLVLIPLYRYTDECIGRNGNYIEHEFIKPKYAFHVWECTLK